MWEQRPDWDSAEGQARSGESISGKENSRCTGPGQEPARGLGDKQEGLCDCRRERGCQVEDEAKKEAGLNGLRSMAKTLGLKWDMKPWIWEGFGYRGMAHT